MRNIWLLILCTLCTFFSVPPVLAADHLSWSKVAGEVAFSEEFAKLPLTLSVSKKASSGSPVSMEPLGGKCVIQVKTKGNPFADALLALTETQNRDVLMRAVIVHEIAHCWRAQDNPEALQALFSLVEQAKSNPQLTAEATYRSQQEETFADVAALSWVERHYEAQFPAMLSAFERLRTDPRFAGSAHDSRAALLRIRRFGMVYGDNPFYAAEITLAALRPGQVWSTSQRR